MKYILRATISITQMIALCLWCFFLGSILGVFMVVAGFFTGLMSGEYGEFWGGVAWCFGHFAFLPFTWLYRNIYGNDEWYKSETLFGI